MKEEILGETHSQRYDLRKVGDSIVMDFHHLAHLGGFKIYLSKKEAAELRDDLEKLFAT